MTTALIYLVVMVGVAGVLFLLASLVFGRGEELAPLPTGTTATVLPTTAVTGSDVRELRFQQVLRGYQAREVDWALDRLANEIDQLRAQLAHRVLDAPRPTPGVRDEVAEQPGGRAEAAADRPAAPGPDPTTSRAPS